VVDKYKFNESTPDNKLFAFTSYANGNPQILLHSVDTGRRMPFYNPVSSVVETPEFTPDSKQLVSVSHDRVEWWDLATGQKTDLRTRQVQIFDQQRCQAGDQHPVDEVQDVEDCQECQESP